ncbi:MAG: VOC family protein [Gammaproteobacteria bacterium]
MKRLHIHLSVDDLDQNIAFYSTLFGAKPTFNNPKAPAHGENPFACRPAGHTTSSCCG